VDYCAVAKVMALRRKLNTFFPPPIFPKHVTANYNIQTVNLKEVSFQSTRPLYPTLPYTFT